jgi:hypothetical protein
VWNGACRSPHPAVSTSQGRANRCATPGRTYPSLKHDLPARGRRHARSRVTGPRYCDRWGSMGMCRRCRRDRASVARCRVPRPCASEAVGCGVEARKTLRAQRVAVEALQVVVRNCGAVARLAELRSREVERLILVPSAARTGILLAHAAFDRMATRPSDGCVQEGRVRTRDFVDTS